MIKKIILALLVLVLLMFLLYLFKTFTVLEVLNKEANLDDLYRIDVEVYKSIDDYVDYSLIEDNEINSFLNILDKIRIRKNLDRVLYTSIARPKSKDTYNIKLLDSNNKIIGRIWIRDKKYISINQNSYSVFNSNAYNKIYKILLNSK